MDPIWTPYFLYILGSTQILKIRWDNPCPGLSRFHDFEHNQISKSDVRIMFDLAGAYLASAHDREQVQIVGWGFKGPFRDPQPHPHFSPKKLWFLHQPKPVHNVCVLNISW